MSYCPKTSKEKLVKDLRSALLLDDIKALRDLFEVINLTLEDFHELIFSAVDFKLSKKTFTVLVEMFNKKNVSLDMLNDDSNANRTALDNACLDGYFDGIEVLIKGGANYQRKMHNSEKTYLDFYKEKHPEMASKIDNLITQRKEKDKSYQDDTPPYKLVRFLRNNFLLSFSKTSGCEKMAAGNYEKTKNSATSFSLYPRLTKSKVD